MTDQEFASNAWLLVGLTRSRPGWLHLQKDRLRFTTPDEVVFDVPRSDLESVRFPWYYFGGGVKLRAAGRPYRLSFVLPNGSEYAQARDSAAQGNASAAVRMAASKVTDIASGRSVGRRWRELLEQQQGVAATTEHDDRREQGT